MMVYSIIDVKQVNGRAQQQPLWGGTRLALNYVSDDQGIHKALHISTLYIHHVHFQY